MTKKQDNNTLYNRKNSKSSYDKHDPYARNKDRRAIVSTCMYQSMNNAYPTSGYDKIICSKRAPEKRTRSIIGRNRRQRPICWKIDIDI